MKIRCQIILSLALLALLNLIPPLSTAFAQGTAFTYDGLLQKGGLAQSGNFDFTFTLFNVDTGGAYIGTPITLTGVPVKNGQFTVTLDFGGAVWNGQYIWLEIAVEGNGDSGPTTLAPRQQIMPTPYAIYAETAANVSGALSSSQLTGLIYNNQLANSTIAFNGLTGLSASPNPVALGGTMTLNNTGVTSLTGGDGVTVSGATGDLTLGLGSSLTLANLPVSINSGGASLLYIDNNGNYFAGLYLGTPGASGGANTATGDYALGDNTSGGANTAYGNGALQGNRSGSVNTAQGFAALSVNQTGFGNTANGAYALFSNLSGSYNVANGMNALSGGGDGTGSYNTANGTAALQGNEAGSFNIGDGASALQYNRIGANNTAVGYSALSQLGVFSGQGGTNNIAIGNGAGIAFNANESSNIDIGNIGVPGDNNITRIGTVGIQTAAYIAGIINGDGSGLINLNASQITGGTINNSQLANSSITINTLPGSGLSGGQAVALGGEITLNNAGVTSLTGGDGVTVSGATGDLTLGLGNTINLTGTFPVGITLQGAPFLYADMNSDLFIGFGAGNSTASAGFNTAAGTAALHSNTSGEYNSAYGTETLYANQLGSQNTANGAYALSSNQNGNNNTAEGNFALEGNQGSGNTGAGNRSLTQNQSGSENTALGDNSLSSLGSANSAGGSYNIAIGSGAGNTFTGNESYDIDIGNAGVLGESGITRIGTPGIQTAAYIAGIITGDGSGLINLNASQITSGTINSSLLANSPITVNTFPGSGLSGGQSVALGGSITLNNTGVISLTGGGGVTVSASSGAVTLGSTATSANTPNTIVSRDGTGSFAAQDLTLAGVLNLPAPAVTINSGANSLLLGDANRDLFVGLAAGNPTSSGSDNTALGYESLQAVSSGYQNTAIGSYSLAANTTGIYNVGVGYLALQQNTDGFGNTACGWESLKVNTDGWYDTAVGTWALQANTTGHNNTAVGYDALGGNTTGTENTAYGVHANLYNETGSNNVAVGWWSLNYCPAGSSNIAVGYEAGINFEDTESGNIDIGNAGEYGDNNTIRIGSVNNTGSNDVANTYIGGIWAAAVSSGLPVVVDSSGHLGVQASSASYGSGNTADGYQALYANSNGIQNTVDGYQALFSNTSGNDNVACGFSALYANTSGGENVAVGAEALQYDTTGGYNTAIGLGALDGVTTGGNNIALGPLAGSQLLGSDANNIDIGNQGVTGDDYIIRIGTPGAQTDTYLSGRCKTQGYGCKQGMDNDTYGNTFNFWWTGSELDAWIDSQDVGVVVSTTSDRRLKENIEPMTDDALTRVMALKPSTFKYKKIPGTIFQGDGTQKEGFIADELQQVIPSAVNGQKDAVTSKGEIQPQTINLTPVVAVLTKAVQDQQKEIEELKAMVKTLSERK